MYWARSLFITEGHIAIIVLLRFLNAKKLLDDNFQEVLKYLLSTYYMSVIILSHLQVLTNLILTKL